MIADNISEAHSDVIDISRGTGAQSRSASSWPTASGDTSANVDSPLVGVGVSYKISEVMDVRADYDHVSNLGKTDKVTSNMLSFGVAYHF